VSSNEDDVEIKEENDDSDEIEEKEPNES